MTAAGGPRRALAALLLAASAPAQSGEPGFADLLARARAVQQAPDAAPESVREAHAAALSAFLRMPSGSAERAARVAEAAWCAWRAGDARMSAALYEEAWRAGPRTGELLEQRLLALLDGGQADLALELARAGDAEFHPAVVNVLSARQRGGDPRLLDAADRLLRAGKHEAGLWAFEQAALGSPGVAFAQANWALALRHVGRTERCEQAYRKALELAADDSLLWNDYGLFLKGVGRLEDAVKAFQRGRELESPPGSSPAIPNLALLERLLQRKLLDDADRALATVLSVRPDAPFPRRVAIDHILAKVKPAK